MSRRVSLTIVICTIAIATLFYGYHRATRAMDHSPRTDGTRDGVSTSVLNNGADRELARRHLASRMEATRIPSIDAQNAATSVVELLSAYVHPTDERFVSLLGRQGLQRGPIPGDDPAAQWLIETSAVRGATLDFANAKVRVVCQGGSNESLYPGQTLDVHEAAFTRFVKTMRGPTDVGNPFNGNATVIEVTLPGTVRNYKSKEGAGEVVIYFAQRASDRQWLVVGTSVQHVRMGQDAIYMAPPVQ